MLQESFFNKFKIEVVFHFNLPLFKVGVDHPVGETFSANTDTLKYTVAGELMHDQMSIYLSCRRMSVT